MGCGAIARVKASAAHPASNAETRRRCRTSSRRKRLDRLTWTAPGEPRSCGIASPRFAGGPRVGPLLRPYAAEEHSVIRCPQGCVLRW